MEKKFKKLVLNKEEIVNLNDYEQTRVKGSVTTGPYCIWSVVNTLIVI